jgi:hypothetical protein
MLLKTRHISPFIIGHELSKKQLDKLSKKLFMVMDIVVKNTWTYVVESLTGTQCQIQSRPKSERYAIIYSTILVFSLPSHITLMSQHLANEII